MKLLQGLLMSGAVAFGVAAVAMAQDGAQPAGPAGAPGGGGFRGGGPRPVHAPAEGGVFGVITSVSAKGFELTAPASQMVTVELAPNTKYRKGLAVSSARAIKVGQRVRVLGAVTFGAGVGAAVGNSTTITATHVVLQPVEGGGSETSLKVAAAVVAVLLPVQNAQGAQGGQGARAAGPGAAGAGAAGGQGPRAGGAAPGAGAGGQARQGLPVPARHIGNINPDWGDAGDSRTTIAAGAEADKATEVAMAQPYSSGGIVDRVVKEPDGAYLVHNIGVSWPHHIFVSADFKPVGAAN
jgi:hypothetical protein